MVLAVDEKYVAKTFQSQIADKDREIKLDDAVKITGCWNGLSKRMATDAEGESLILDPTPMRRAVAFSHSIRDSKRFTELFAEIIDEYREQRAANGEDGFLNCEVRHVDGTYNALRRNEKLDWLKAEDASENTCRILSNARCLAEGVDVPALDAVIFLNPRNSVVDVVQSVGRVMRRAPGKKYGYIILPIGIPADVSPEEALKDNKKYRVVWQVLQALRAHDDRFNATINQLELNRKRPDQIQVIGVGGGQTEDEIEEGRGTPKYTQMSLAFPNLAEWKDAIYARIVQRVGDRRYWEDWAKDVAQIAERHITRIKALLEDPLPEHKEAFDSFLSGLHENINPNVTADEAIEMLAQHLITRPVFDALFEGYAFTDHNPVSRAMQQVLEVLDSQALEKEVASLEKFYQSVRERAAGIDNAEGKQKVIVELYEKFFRTAFPRMADRLGIVYTPTEVVDFIIRSADAALRQEFGVGLTDEGVHILDPFTGTGTFIVRLLQSGLVKPEDLTRKFRKELHCNEIVLLAYYIAAINIEETYHDLARGDYEPFPGIVLTDTFQMTEGKGTLDEVMFPENNERAVRQSQAAIRVIVGNPPYSVGQSSANDNNQNLKYPQLDGRIRDTYAVHSSATNKNNLYDSYIRAIRWASDRIGDRGAICYVSNGKFIDGQAADGLRKCLVDEFTSIHCFNLRGDQRTQGEQSRREGGKIFGEGSRTPIAITLLVKNPERAGPCKLYYHDIGDYLSREQKLAIIAEFQDITKVPWRTITPDVNHDWINQRDLRFEGFIPLGDKANKASETIFTTYSRGVATSRDAWAYNFSSVKLAANMRRMIDFYNEQVEAYRRACAGAASNDRPDVNTVIDINPTKISWSRGLKADLTKLRQHAFSLNHVTASLYRPFCKQWLYFDRHFNDMVYRMPSIFPIGGGDNLVIAVTSDAARREFSVLLTDMLPDLELVSKSQVFPLYYYDEQETDADQGGLFDGQGDGGLVRRDAIADKTLERFRAVYSDLAITKEDIFYYVYGILHSTEYRERFAADLTKMLPRIPFAQDFWSFSKAGRELADWHLKYESVEPYPLDEIEAAKAPADPRERFRVQKMAFGRRGRQVDKSTIIYNSHITLSGIPEKAYEYVVNGKPAIEWIMDRYVVKTDKASGITNDPNDWSEAPRYIVDLVSRIVRVSLETVRIVEGLPPLNELDNQLQQYSTVPFSVAMNRATR